MSPSWPKMPSALLSRGKAKRAVALLPLLMLVLTVLRHGTQTEERTQQPQGGETPPSPRGVLRYGGGGPQQREDVRIDESSTRAWLRLKAKVTLAEGVAKPAEATDGVAMATKSMDRRCGVAVQPHVSRIPWSAPWCTLSVRSLGELSRRQAF